MKSFNRIFAAVITAIILIFIAANAFILKFNTSNDGRPYRVEAGRIANDIKENGLENVNLSKYKYIKNVCEAGDNFYACDSDYLIREIDGRLYRFDYLYEPSTDKAKIAVIMNLSICAVSVFTILIMLYIRQNILLPFEKLIDVPYQLSKGNLTVPIKESKNRFFGKFVWGLNLLREHTEQQKMRELSLQKDKKTLLLSISHDIKTPLSAIKLYSKALSKGLYSDRDEQIKIAENINSNADEIEGYISQIITASKEDFLSLDVNSEDFYLSSLIKNITNYYTEKLSLIRISFNVGNYHDCLLKGDLNRSVEVLQNIIENAIKYGDGNYISIDFSYEENCVLTSVKNSGCTLSLSELPHIFDSFWRGHNSSNTQGSGLGLYICRQLMHKMGGDIFAKTDNDSMTVTAVFEKA